MTKSSSIVRFLFFLVFFLSCHSVVVDDDIAIIRERVLDLMIWPSKGAIPQIVVQALTYARTLNHSCYWPDIDYQDRSIVIWKTKEHMTRISVMLQALTVNGSSVQNDPILASMIHCALAVWLVNDWQNPNWWFNQISVPMIAAGQLLMLDNNATDFEIAKIKEISFRAAWWLNRSQDTGANLVDMLKVQLFRSLATSNISSVEQVFTRVWQDIAIMSIEEEGIQHDWSYHFHGQQLLSGSYGVIWVQDIFQFMSFSYDTVYQANEQQLLLFAQFLTQGDAWMIIGNEWDWNVIGRSISRPAHVTLADIAPQQLRFLAQFLMMNDTKIDLLNFANRLENQPNASRLLGNRHFFTSDYQVHRRVNWTSAIKMQSVRTQGSECTNGENIKDEHGGQGVLNLYKTHENNYNNIFPLIDWQAINGITVEHDIALEPCEYSGFPQIKLPFVGGVSDRQYGLAMMDTASHNLTARRSWHFYDDTIVALATNLKLPTPNTAWTTLASRALPSGQITVGFYNSTTVTLPDGLYSFSFTDNETTRIQWIHVGDTNIGYLLRGNYRYNSIGINIENKTGNYKTIGVYNVSVNARLLTIWIDHGRGPYVLDYTYFIFPDVSLSFMPLIIQQYEKEDVFSCLSTNDFFHGIMWPSLKRASFVLWDNITTTFSCQSPLFRITIQLHDAGAYLYSETDVDFTLTMSHPMRTNGNIIVNIDRLGYGDGCSSIVNIDGTRNTDVTLILPTSMEFLGASVNVTCKKSIVSDSFLLTLIDRL